MSLSASEVDDIMQDVRRLHPDVVNGIAPLNATMPYRKNFDGKWREWRIQKGGNPLADITAAILTDLAAESQRRAFSHTPRIVPPVRFKKRWWQHLRRLDVRSI
jgi:hypothetical protein